MATAEQLQAQTKKMAALEAQLYAQQLSVSSNTTSPGSSSTMTPGQITVKVPGGTRSPYQHTGPAEVLRKEAEGSGVSSKCISFHMH